MQVRRYAFVVSRFFFVQAAHFPLPADEIFVPLSLLFFFRLRVRSAREKRHLAKISSSSEGAKRCVLITSNAVFARVCRAEDDRLRPARNASLYNSITTMCLVEFLHLMFFLFALCIIILTHEKRFLYFLS